MEPSVELPIGLPPLKGLPTELPWLERLLMVTPLGKLKQIASEIAGGSGWRSRGLGKKMNSGSLEENTRLMEKSRRRMPVLKDNPREKG